MINTGVWKKVSGVRVGITLGLESNGYRGMGMVFKYKVAGYRQTSGY